MAVAAQGCCAAGTKPRHMIHHPQPVTSRCTFLCLCSPHNHQHAHVRLYRPLTHRQEGRRHLHRCAACGHDRPHACCTRSNMHTMRDRQPHMHMRACTPRALQSRACTVRTAVMSHRPVAMAPAMASRCAATHSVRHHTTNQLFVQRWQQERSAGDVAADAAPPTPFGARWPRQPSWAGATATTS
jgi:hypothetical protein